MADSPQKYTNFKDPFDLLNELRNLGMERLYKNTFARGSREDMSMGYHEHPNSSIGKISSPQYNLGVNAPSTQWTPRQGSGGKLPNPVNINYERDFGNPGLDRRELKRIGTVAGPMASVAQSFISNISEIRRRQKKERQEQIENDQKTQEVAPQIKRLGELEQEMGDVQSQMENTRLRMNVGEGLLERRKAQRQAQAQSVQAQHREGFYSASPNVATSVKGEYPPGHPIGMLTESNQGNVTAQAASIFNMQPPSPLGSPSASPQLFDIPKSNIQPGETSPWPNINKAQNTSALGGAPSTAKQPIPPHLENRAMNARKKAKESTQNAITEEMLVTPENPPINARGGDIPYGYNPSQGTPLGPPSMHRRRPR